MTSNPENQADLPFNAPETPEEELESLRRSHATLDAIFAECVAAGYDGSTTLVGFIKSKLQANNEKPV